MKVKKLFAFAAIFGAFALAAAETAAPAVVEVFANNNANAFKTVKLPALELQEGEKAVLTFKAWLKSNTTAGWTYPLAVRLNGKVLNNANAMIRKEVVAEMGKNKVIEKMPLFDKKNQALVFYAKDITQPLDKRIISDREQGFCFKLDVTDMVAADRENYLTLHNTRPLYSLRKIFKDPKYEFVICVSDIKLSVEK